jgi:hypothetical protein
MKKQIFAIAAIAIAGSGILYSCKKDANVAPESTQQAQVKKAGGVYTQDHFHTVYPNYDDDLGDCGAKTGNCIPDIVIKPKINSSMLDVLSSGNPVATAQYFSDVANQKSIPANILNNAELMKFLSSGSAHTKLYVSATDKKVFLIGETSDLTTANSMVMPVKLQD